ncbi:MAG: putative protein-S-isoprenylcysteine methyltransferase-like protein [Gammaproteobacteria bacterium]|nr:putative protein-S-isoprenylcysteine methyltransferase-like protein [Gammaproteobacteria bacterium]
MRWLEHKIPPPVVGLVVGSGMWSGAQITPLVQVGESVRVVIALAFVVFGLAVTLLGVIAFRRVRTTVNPLQPEAASSLVIVGVYRYTRNPMYVGLASVLVGWAVYLSAPLVLVGPALFVLFISRFQIIPEERVLSEKFGREFAEYQQKVRRWL